MAFKPASQKFNAAIREVEIGSGDKKITLGGECTLPFYTFDAEIPNAPKVGVELTDTGIDETLAGLKDFYAGAATLAEQAAMLKELFPDAKNVGMLSDLKVLIQTVKTNQLRNVLRWQKQLLMLQTCL